MLPIALLYIMGIKLGMVIVVSDETEHGLILNVHLFTQILW